MAVRKVSRKKKSSSPAKATAPSIEYMKDGSTNSPPENLADYCVLIFGEKGIGKTTLAGSVPGAYVNQYELRRRNVPVRQTSIRVLSVKDMTAAHKKAKRSKSEFHSSWEQIRALHDIQMNDDSVTTIIEDTVDQAWKACLAHTCYERGYADPTEANDYGATWRAIKDDFLAEYARILDAGKSLWFISHATFKEVELRGDDTYEILVPSCEKGAFEFLKQSVDFAFYYGYHEQRRVLRLRGSDEVWAACGSAEHFCDTNGNPLEFIEMGSNPQEAYERMQAAFENKTPAPTTTKKKRTRRKK